MTKIDNPLDIFREFNGYVIINTECTFEDRPKYKNTWSFTYRSVAHDIKIERQKFETYNECVEALLEEHERVSAMW